MGPLPSTALTLVFLLCGAVAVWSMADKLGSRTPLPMPHRSVHRIAGWGFVLLFVVVFLTMLQRIENYWEESPPRVAIHFALAIALLFLILLKVGIARYYKGLGKNLFALGVACYLAAFPMAVVTSTYYLLRVIEGTPYISHAEVPALLDERLGKELLINKCAPCHELRGILRPRTARQWEVIVNRMMAIARPRITPGEARQVLHYLVLNHVPRDVITKGEGGPFERFCAPCHTLQEIQQHRLDVAGWERVVRRMRQHAPDVIPEEKIPEIVQYLATQQQSWPPPGVGGAPP